MSCALLGNLVKFGLCFLFKEGGMGGRGEIFTIYNLITWLISFDRSIQTHVAISTIRVFAVRIKIFFKRLLTKFIYKSFQHRRLLKIASG